MTKSRRKLKRARNSPHRDTPQRAVSAGAAAVVAEPAALAEPQAPVAVESARSWRDRLFDPIDIASIAVFRISLGLLLFYDVCTYFANGWIKSYYIDPPFHFAFFGWEFIRPLPAEWMYALFGVLGVSSLLVAVGLFYRVALTVFVLGFAYIFLLDEARYLNHFYFAGLLAFLMIFVPADRGWSLRALIARRSQDARIPAWSVWILRAQVEVMLIYAGIVKLNSDWLQGEPLTYWLSLRTELPLIGPLLSVDEIALIGAWSAALLHLIGAVMLLFKSTRLYAFVAYCTFHFLNHLFFNISIFPWLTIAATLLFFDPDWPKIVWRRVTMLLRLPSRLQPAWQGAIPELHPWRLPSPAMQTAIVSLIVGWTLFQVLLPGRHVLYRGDTSWHEQGSWFSWQMMLRQKRGIGRFYVRDPDTKREWLVDPEDYLTWRQERYMFMNPEMIRHFAHYLEREWARRYGTRDVEVRAFTAVSLNGRPARPLVDPSRDLSKIGYTFGPSDWILPLNEPLPPRGERWPGDEPTALLRLIDSDSDMRRLWASRDAKQVSSRRD